MERIYLLKESDDRLYLPDQGAWDRWGIYIAGNISVKDTIETLIHEIVEARIARWLKQHHTEEFLAYTLAHKTATLAEKYSAKT